MKLQIDFMKLILALTLSNLLAIKLANCYKGSKNNKIIKLCMQSVGILIASTAVLFCFGDTIQTGGSTCEYASMPVNTGVAPF